MIARWLPFGWGLMFVLMVACGDDGSTGPSGGGGSGGSGPGTSGNGGSGGSSGSGGSGGSAGSGGSGNTPACNGITGTYDITRTRSKSNPGSCPPTYSVNPSIPGKVTADSASPSGFKFEIGYSDPDGKVVFLECTNNVNKCSIFATCANSDKTLTDQVTLDVSGNGISGTIARIVKDMNDCTVNFDLSGTRQ
jgi:hypothetical protein